MPAKSYKKTILPNGIRILTLPKREALSVSVLILADVGAKNEDDKHAGLSHFLEHMCFKGTAKRPKAIDIATAMDSIGANYNAVTSHDFTGYYATVIPEQVDKAVDILADIYQHPLYNAKEIEKEKGVVKEEIKLYEDTPSSFVWDVFLKLTYDGQPQGRTVLGTREVISSLRRDDLLTFRKKHYLASATTIAVVGKFNERQMIKLVTEKFSQVSSGEPVLLPSVIEDQSVPRIKIANKTIDQTHLILGFRSFDIYDRRIFALNVLAAVLGGSASSRLFQKIREEMGVAYYVGATQSAHQKHGFFAIYAGVNSRRVKSSIKTILAECQKLKTDLVGAKELKLVKDALIGNLFLGLETPSDLSSFFGEQEALHKKIISPETYARKIRAITVADLKEVANDIFRNDRLNLALVGPHQTEAEFLVELKMPE